MKHVCKVTVQIEDKQAGTVAKATREFDLGGELEESTMTPRAIQFRDSLAEEIEREDHARFPPEDDNQLTLEVP